MAYLCFGFLFFSVKSGESYKVTDPTFLPVVASPICTTFIWGFKPLITSSLAEADDLVVRIYTFVIFKLLIGEEPILSVKKLLNPSGSFFSK